MDSFHPIIGGGESHARLLARKLHSDGARVFVLTRRRPPWASPREIVDGYPVVRVRPRGMPRWGKYLMMLPAARALYRRRHDYDVIYVCGMRTLGIVGAIAGRLLGKACVLRSESCGELLAHDITRHSGPSRIPPVRALLKALVALRNRVLLRADHFVAISSAIEAEYREAGVLDAMVTRIPNGIDTDEFAPPSPREKTVLRQEFGLPDATLVMYTGKLNRGKGLELLLQVWAELVGEHQAHLVLVGSGQHQALSVERELRAFVRTHSLEQEIIFTGATDRVADYLKAADLFVMPSESESQCISLIEAMATGLPAVATAVGGIPEYFEDGRHGVLVQPRDGGALGRGLRTLLEEGGTHREWSRAARDSVLGRFRIAGVARRHTQLFEELGG